MNKEKQGNELVAGGIGFILGWFLHRPKVTVPASLTLSNLTITPNPANAGDTVTITADVVSTVSQSSEIVLHIGEYVLSQNVNLLPDTSVTLSWMVLA